MSHESMETGIYISSLDVAFHGLCIINCELQYCTLLIHEATFVFKSAQLVISVFDINTWSWRSKVCVFSVLTVSVLSVPVLSAVQTYCGVLFASC